MNGSDISTIDFSVLAQAMGDLNENKVKELTDAFMKDDSAQVSEFIRALTAGMKMVSDHFDESDYFVGDLIYAGEIFSGALRKVSTIILNEKKNEKKSSKKTHRVLLCTVEGDYHDIGKNIVHYMMEAKGIEVIDLGVDVPPAEILRRAKDEKINVIALSGLMSIALESMENTIRAFQEEGLRDKVKILIGGSCADEHIANTIGADAFGGTPEESASICLSWLSDR